MPAELDAVSAGTDLIAGGLTSGAKAILHPGTTEDQDVAAFLGVVFTTGVDLTAATFTPTWGGVAMSLLAAKRFWDSNRGMLAVYKLEDPPPGPRTVNFAWSGVASEGLITRNLMLIPSTYRGVASIGTPVDAGGGATTSNSVVVPSVLPAHRVASWHGVGKLRGFTAWNKARRQRAIMLGGGMLLQQDAEGAANVTMTATHDSSSVNWAAFAVSLAPAVVSSKVHIPLALSMKSAGGTYRTAPPGKFWEIPADAPVGETL